MGQLIYGYFVSIKYNLIQQYLTLLKNEDTA